MHRSILSIHPQQQPLKSAPHTHVYARRRGSGRGVVVVVWCGVCMYLCVCEDRVAYLSGCVRGVGESVYCVRGFGERGASAAQRAHSRRAL